MDHAWSYAERLRRLACLAWGARRIAALCIWAAKSQTIYFPDYRITRDLAKLTGDLAGAKAVRPEAFQALDAVVSTSARRILRWLS